MIRVSELLSRSGRSSLANFFSLSKVWKEAVTQNIARVTTPVRLDDKGLFVLVHDNIWLTELNYLKKELTERLAEKGLTVKKLTFKYSPAYVRRGKKKLPRFELTEAEKNYIEKMAANIDNEILSASFRNAMTAYFSRHTFEEFINGKEI